MYDENLVKPMREEVTSIGFKQLMSSADVTSELTPGSDDETAMVFINSVCGCSAGGARPALKIAIDNGGKTAKLLTVFAGQETDAVSTLRSMCHGFAPSSPAIAFFKGGKIQSMIERRDIEGYNKLQIAEKIVQHVSQMS